jgi:hypothetical protein
MVIESSGKQISCKEALYAFTVISKSLLFLVLAHNEEEKKKKKKKKHSH